ncbi:S1C family serine protease [Sandaracinus amylolyticus]|uniref:S1C family serine protease n=1 Tax=Sandaracinus amylolyticus TaxID=927083 RepID=UPI001F3BD64E|nr:trypsin-like peptidase domain-containing protein [Sandaracinus amylolyticus]UJR86746.1 Hypothetical protein I5071_88470 [Sandaracinus amylolyticus]
MSGSMLELGDSLAVAVERASASVVQVVSPRRASGTVWSDDLVVTAAHVVRSDDARVRLHDGTERAAQVIGGDPATDVAVLRVDGGGLTPITFADASAVKVGHLTLALGRPGRSVRASLRMIGVMGSDVPTRAGARLVRWIESDRALPAGFSGGPLVDVTGAAIGMSTDGLVRGADLALPKEELARVVDEITAHGQVRRGWLGVAVHPVRLPDAVGAEVQQRSGALIVAVEPKSPADVAGLVLGDVIWAIDGAKVRGPEDLIGALRSRVDQSLRVSIVRSGRLEDRTVTTVARAA